MGKFDGILLCTDLDGTLLNDSCKVSDENIKAIEYFKSEGGKFTFTTGRVPFGARLAAEYVNPNLPIVSFNGAGIYDFDKSELLWGMYLDKQVIEVIDYIVERLSGVGIIVCTDERTCFCIMNRWVDDYFKTENLPLDTTAYKDIKEPWKKALFITEAEDTPTVKKLIADSPYHDLYTFVQSSPYYYEILPKGASKGAGLKKLTELADINPQRTIAIGDNDNDVSMLKTAQIGIAVANATDNTKASADIITVSNNESAIAKVIYDLEQGKIKI